MFGFMEAKKFRDSLVNFRIALKIFVKRVASLVSIIYVNPIKHFHERPWYELGAIVFCRDAGYLGSGFPLRSHKR